MTDNNNLPQTVAEVETALKHLRDKRGYLLPIMDC